MAVKPPSDPTTRIKRFSGDADSGFPAIVFPSEMSEPIVNLYSDGSGGPGALPNTMVPLGRMGTSQDMGGTLLYLASRAGAYCNGTVIVIDGGRLGTFPSSN